MRQNLAYILEILSPISVSKNIENIVKNISDIMLMFDCANSMLFMFWLAYSKNTNADKIVPVKYRIVCALCIIINEVLSMLCFGNFFISLYKQNIKEKLVIIVSIIGERSVPKIAQKMLYKNISMHVSPKNRQENFSGCQSVHVDKF